MLRSPALALASLLGAGCSPKAPGTVGSAVSLIPLWWLLPLLTPTVAGLVLLVVMLIGTWAAQAAGQQWGKVDHGAIVIDELAGQWIAIGIPALFMPGFEHPEVPWVLFALGFALFRLFDIAKPWPANWFDRRVKNGFGVMMDDVVAGIYAGLVTMLGLLLLASFG